MDILSLLDQLEQLIAGGKKTILSGDKVLVDPQEIYYIIDQLRTSVPQEIRDAQWIKKEEDRIKSNAIAENERIIKEAQAEAERLVEESQIVRMSEERGKEIILSANKDAQDITMGAFQYANDIMEKIEKQLSIYFDVIQDGKAEIQKTLEDLQQMPQE